MSKKLKINSYSKDEINDLIAPINTNFNKLTYWKKLTITGSGTRTVAITGGLKTNTKYLVELTWGNNTGGNRTFIPYQHQGQSNNTDIQRYIVSSVAGLLPNVIALANNFGNGFKIYAAIGTENQSGFIFNVYEETLSVS